MISNTNNVLVLLGIITILFEMELSYSQEASFLELRLMDILFPKESGLRKIRKLDNAKGTNDVIALDFIGIVEQYDYQAEKHNVTTEDGYNLVIHRISRSPLWNNQEKKEVIFLQHGFLCSSEVWIIFGPGKDLAFLLADQGYDVWVGNIRGNSYGRLHVNLATYDREFWQFSFHEMGSKDLPATIDYVLEHTGRNDLFYIGHSMGSTLLFVLLSTRPEYNARIKLGICLGPSVFWTEITPTLKRVINFVPRIKTFIEKYKVYDILPQSLTTVTLARMFCNDRAITQALCITVIFLIAGSDPTQLNTTALPYLLSHVPAGASVKTLLHFYQNIIANDFRNYDYGTIDNYKRYNQERPLSYELRNITNPIALFYSANDVFATEMNVHELNKRLPNVVLMEEVPFKLFSHIDFLWAIDAKTLLYDRVIEVIRNFGHNRNIVT